MSIELKIKSKHLGEEARIIRFEERKLLKQIEYNRKKFAETGNNEEYPLWGDKVFQKYTSISYHRKRDVRFENRATFLARTYLAGKSYDTAEQTRKPEKEYDFKTRVLPRVVQMINKYKNPSALLVTPKEIEEWTQVKAAQ